MVFAPLERYLLIADDPILAIPTRENGELLVDIAIEKEIAFGSSPEIENNCDYTKMRRTVLAKLLKAQQLLPKGLFFCLYEAYRSLELQNQLFMARQAKLRKQHPNWSEQQLFTETTRLVSPVVNFDGSINIPPHSTGGAIDVYLINENGDAVDMGMHPKDWIHDLQGQLSLTHSSVISPRAQKNRQLMAEALHALGFINYPAEYWHWSYGDRYWAYYKPHAYALYASVCG